MRKQILLKIFWGLCAGDTVAREVEPGFRGAQRAVEGLWGCAVVGSVVLGRYVVAEAGRCVRTGRGGVGHLGFGFI